jgi:thiamine biosynthesis protein ThiC
MDFINRKEIKMDCIDLIIGLVSEKGGITIAEIRDILKEEFTYSQIYRAIDILCKRDVIYPVKDGYRYK